MSTEGAIGSADLAVMRAANPHGVLRYLTVVPPNVIMTARINQAAFTYPLAEITIDTVAFPGGGSLTDVLAGMDVWIGTSATELRNVFVGRLRKVPTPSPTPTTLYVEELGSGATDIPRTYYRELANNYYVTIVETMSAWYAFPRISGGVIYKDWDESFTTGAAGQGGTGAPPIANISFRDGTRPVAFVDPTTNLYRASLTGSTSFQAGSGNPVASYTWTLPAGCAFVGGTGANDEDIDVDCPVGEGQWIKLVVTDGFANTATARFPLNYYDADNMPLQVLQVDSDVRDLKGRRVSLTVNPKEMDLDDIPHGALCIYWEDQYFGTAQNEYTVDWFLGWSFREDLGLTAQGPSTRLEILGPVHLLDQTAAVPQRVVSDTSPANWQEVLAYLCNVPGMYWYLFYWHLRNLATLCDIRLLETEGWERTNQPAFGSGDLAGTQAGRQFHSLASRLPANFGADSSGACRLVRDPQYLESRVSVVDRITLLEADIASIRPVRSHRLSTSTVRASGFVYAGAAIVPVLSQAPDLTPAQAPSRLELRGMIVGSQNHLNWLSGAHWAVLNNPWDIEIVLARNLDVFEPCRMDRLSLEVTAAMLADAEYGATWRRLLDLQADPATAQELNLYVQSVAISHEANSTRKTIQLRCVPEVVSTPGVTIPIPQFGEYPEPAPDIDGPSSPDDEQYTYDPDDVLLIAVDDGSQVKILSTDWDDFVGGSPAWTVCATVAYDFYDLVLDAQDPYNVGYVMRRESNNIDVKVYRCANISDGASQVWSLADTIVTDTGGLSPTTGGGLGRLITDFYRPGWVAFGYCYSRAIPDTYAKSIIYHSDQQATNFIGTTIFPDVGKGYGASPPGQIAHDLFGGGRLVSFGFKDTGAVSLTLAIFSGYQWGYAFADWTERYSIGGQGYTVSSLFIPYRKSGGAANSPATDVLFTKDCGGTPLLAKTTDLFTTGYVDITPEDAGTKYSPCDNPTGYGIATALSDGDKIAVAGRAAGAAAGRRVFFSSNGGGTWNSLAVGTDPLIGVRAVVDADGADILIYYGYDGLKWSDDWGTSWNNAEGDIASKLGVAHFTVDKLVWTEAARYI